MVRPLASAMFYTHAATGSLRALLVGARVGGGEWQPAIETVTIEHVIVQGIKLRHGRHSIDIGWPLFGSVHAPQSFVVFVRNDAPELRELRVVLALDGESDGRARRRRLR